MPAILAVMPSADIFNALFHSVRWTEFVAGLGLFLLGMLQMEGALERLAGQRIKALLRARTHRPLSAVASGALTTALLQSSSLVGLLTLAMVGAQIIALESALGIIIGANLGTTISGWIVATVGFKLNLTSAAVPLIAIGSIGLVMGDEATRRTAIFRFTVGFGLLLFGLDFMKASVATQTLILNAGHHPWLMLGAGVVVTAVIQSSSAAMLITLAALNAGAISLPDAAAFIIGADLGTTSTVLFGAIRGSADKRRVGLAHLLFNVVNNAIAFFVLLPLLPNVLLLMPAADPLFVLVGFHSAFNLLGVILFLPLLGPFARGLKKFFARPPAGLVPSLDATLTADMESALAALGAQVVALAVRVREFHLVALKDDVSAADSVHRRAYKEIKLVEGELLAFAIQLQKQRFSATESQRLEALIDAMRNLVHSAKSIKDCSADLAAMQQSLTAPHRHLYLRFHTMLDGFHERTAPLLTDSGRTAGTTVIDELEDSIRASHDAAHHAIYQLMTSSDLDWPTVSSILNANRELFIASEDFTQALRRLLFSRGQLSPA